MRKIRGKRNIILYAMSGMGINMLELSSKRIKIANMLPAIFLPIGYIPLAALIGSFLK